MAKTTTPPTPEAGPAGKPGRPGGQGQATPRPRGSKPQPGATNPGRSPIRWVIIALVVVALVVALILIIPRVGNSDGGNSPAASDAAASSDSPTLPDTSAPTDSPTPTPSPTTPPSGADLVAWRTDLEADLGEGFPPWTNVLVDAGDVWLASVVVGDPEAGPGSSGFITIDPATGKLLTPLSQADLPETVTCAETLLDGQAVCAWGGQLHLVDPHTGTYGTEPFATVEVGGLYYAAVTGQKVIAAGLNVDRAIVVSIDQTGTELWSSDIVIDGCYANDPAATSQVAIAGTVAKVGVGSYQAVVDLASGNVEAKVCGRSLLAQSGALGRLANNASEPAPPASYQDTAGGTHLIQNLTQADDALSVQWQGHDYFAIIDTDQYLSLLDADTGEVVWKQATSLSAHSLFQGVDDERLYIGSINGLKAVTLADGVEQWLAGPAIGVAYRTAAITDGVVIVMTSVGMTGIDPVTGEVVWDLANEAATGYYWTPTMSPTPPGQTSLVILGPAKSVLTRLDLGD